MDKTININVGGSLFHIDDKAFQILRNWLQEINNRFRNVQGGLETIEDIELRVAEIFNSQKGIAGVITRENVEAMISIIGKPEDFDQDESESAGQKEYHTDSRRRLYRNPQDSIISGVCGGLGAYLNTDPVIFRILFAISVLVFGSGFLIYIVLWIALPPARSETQMRELFGNNFHSHNGGKTYDGTMQAGVSSNSSGYNQYSHVGNAFNEIFTAIGRVCFIILRVFLIIFGVAFVITGFLSILSYLFIFVFKYPEVFSINGIGMNMNYLPDLLNYIVSPSTVPWIMILSSVVFILPMLALIYWGVKMIFWFKAHDGIFSLGAFVIWVMALSSLSLILFNEGTSFANTARTTSESYFSKPVDTLYIVTASKISDLNIEKEVDFPHDEYNIYINDEKRELYIKPNISVRNSDDKIPIVEIRKRCAARTQIEAMKRLDGLQYNYSISHDTLHLDEYFTIPNGRKWSADNIGINLYIPVGTIVKMDRNSSIIYHSRYHYGHYYHSDWAEPGQRIWVMTDDGLRYAE